MKTIVLMPVKNEDWILNTTLSAVDKIAEHVIVAEQMSTDKSVEIASRFDKVTIIENRRDKHSNEVRWDLLEKARSLYGVGNLIVCIDADEVLPPFYFNKIKDRISQISPGAGWITSPWVQLWRSVYTYRNDASVWSPLTNKKPFAFIDDGVVSYEKSFVINDHTSRVPGASNTKLFETNVPLIHFQFANWQRSQEKQAWYRCKELIHGNNPEQINQKYSITKNENGLSLEIVPQKWFDSVDVTPKLEILEEKSWYVKEIEGMFYEHGKDMFKKLDIWDVIR